jgi:hypothetical protein
MDIWAQIEENLSHGIFQKDSDINYQNAMIRYSHHSEKTWNARKDFIKNFSWAIPSREAIQEITNFWGQDFGIEIGAGSGLWSHLLQLKGVNVIPTDTKEEESNFSREYTIIEQLEANETIKKYSDANVLFLCWSRVDPISNFKGDKIVYIGEDEGGCTNGIPNNDDWELIKIIAIPTWFGMRDFLALYTRRT